MKRALPLALALAACSPRPAPLPPPEPAPKAAPAAVPAPVRPAPRPRDPVAERAALRSARVEAARAESVAPSAASADMARYLAAAQAQLLARGKLRSAGAPDEAAVTPESLARDFVRIALRDEYTHDAQGALVPGGAPAPLRRWRAPVRLQLDFGPSVDPATRAATRADVATLAAQLGAATGHPIALTGGSGNFRILVLAEDERADVGARLARLLPGVPAADVAALRDLPRETFCTAFAYSRDGGPATTDAVALIRAELPPLLRRSCLHEELAQGLGLASDSFAARPSIFNDDEEFGFLTLHDVALLGILYDPALRPGMTEAEAAPIVLRLAAERLGR